MARYRWDPAMSRFTAQAFATGALSFFGHSPSFAAREFRGELDLDQGQIQALDLVVDAGSLALVDQVSPSDRAEIEGRMRTDVLETAAYPEVAFRTEQVAIDVVGPGRYRLRIGGRLSLHGVTGPHRLEAELTIFEDGIRLHGGCPLRMSDYGIKPVSALGGTIRLKDEVNLSFDLAGSPEGP